MLAIVLAGGLGTRLRSVVGDLPKPLAPVRGRPFLEHLMDRWIGQGVTRFALSVGYRHETITRAIGNVYRNCRIDYVIEPATLGTGGGLLLAAGAAASGGSVLVLNGDTYFAVPLQEMLGVHDRANAAITIALFSAPAGSRYDQVTIDGSGRILSLQAGGAASDYLANGGVYLVRDLPGLSARCGNARPLSLERDILVRELDSGSALRGFPCAGAFIDIGVPDDYARAPSVLPL